MFRRKDPGLADANLLDIRPVRTAEWSEGEEDAPEADEAAKEGEAADSAPPVEPPSSPRVTVERAPPPTQGPRGWLARLSFLTGVKKLRLDDLGSSAWRRLDGSRTVGQVIEGLREEFGEGCEPAEERLAMFLGLLRREQLIGYPGWDDERIAAFRSGSLERRT